MYNGSVMGAIKLLAENNMSTSTINEYIRNLCKDYKVLVTMADRVNRSCVHQSDSIRTIISFAKQERFYQN
jgi:mannitol-specific phosphotransferase system IIBC component